MFFIIRDKGGGLLHIPKMPRTSLFESAMTCIELEPSISGKGVNSDLSIATFQQQMVVQCIDPSYTNAYF